MGLDAHVYCNCLREGKLKTQPPVALERIFIDPVEGIVEIQYPEGMSQKEQDDLWYEVNRWSRHCCEHDGMYFCDVRVGNWSSVRALQEAVLASGKYSVLAGIFPSGNGGIVEVETARQACAELNTFCAEINGRTGIFLVDAETENTIYSYISCYDGIFSLDGKAGVDMGFDKDGLFARSRQTKEILFRSCHVRQTLLPPEERIAVNGRTYTVTPALLTDIQSGQEYKIASKIGWQESPAELKVIERKLENDDFFSIRPLLELFQAVEFTGNPIFWT